MKKHQAVAGVLILLAGFVTPSNASTDYEVVQRTLAPFSGSLTMLTTLQKDQINGLVESNPTAEKFICTGIRFESAPMSENIIVRARAKAACDYAKQLNPSLSTYFQSKASKSKSYSGKVLLTVKVPLVDVPSTPDPTSSAAPSATPTQSPTPTSSPQPSTSSSVPDMSHLANRVTLSSEICKIKENSRSRKPGDAVTNFLGQAEIRGRYPGNATAFPFAPTVLPITGEIDMALIYVDWADNSGSKDDYDYYQQQVKYFKDFYWMASENKLDMKIHSSAQWFRVNGSYEALTLGFNDEAQRGEAPKKQVFYDAAVAAADPSFDFTDIEIVFFAIPRGKSVFFHGGPHEFNFDWNGYVKTNERTIYDTTAPGDWFLRSGGDEPPWVNYVHEVGHMLGIPHQANEGNQQEQRLWVQNPMNGYEIMANQGGAFRTMSTWLRWLSGWLDDSQIACTTKDQVVDEYYELTPINVVRGEKEALVIKLSDTKVIVVESRRFDPYFDRKTPNNKNGVIAYTVDATKGSAQGNQALLSPRDITKYIYERMWRTGDELDAMFFQGDSVVIEGIKIQAYSIGKSRDLVRVSKTN
jgi:M6 family metalloprotease-like protein